MNFPHDFVFYTKHHYSMCVCMFFCLHVANIKIKSTFKLKCCMLFCVANNIQAVGNVNRINAIRQREKKLGKNSN